MIVTYHVSAGVTRAEALAALYDSPVSRLRLIPQAPAPEKERVRQRVKAMPKPATMLQCRCGSRDMIETKSGVLFKDGRASGGTKMYLCLHCLIRGERVVVA